MGSNQNRHGDKKLTSEWGSKSRKDAYRDKARAFKHEAIADSIESNGFAEEPENVCCGGDSKTCRINGPCSIERERRDMWEDDAPARYLAPQLPKKRRRKDTKLWCRGKEGREHVWVLIERSKGFRRFRWSEYRCDGCQKKKHEWLD